MENLFDNIIEKDEQIIKVIKPNKARYWKDVLVFFIIPILWPALIMMLVFTLFTAPFFYARGYKNLCYAYTNKRLIVRSGIWGVDFQSLEYKDITSTSVSVGFLDKGGKTGSLVFVSPSTHNNMAIKFQFIEKPYETMKEIKEYINENNKA